MISLTDVRLPEASHVFVSNVLTSGHLSQGPYVEGLECLVAAASDTVYAVAVNSGTAALQLAVQTVCEPGDRVAVPGFTFAGSANAVLAAGCVPVVVDVDDDFLIDESKIPDDVQAVMPVHLYGQKKELGCSLPVIEDAAQAIGHHISHGAVSLYGSKTVGCGEGGVFVTNNHEAAEKARVFRNQGMESRYNHVGSGFNFRLTDLQAAVVIPQLVRLADTIRKRRENAALLMALLELGDLPADHYFHQFVVEVDNRDQVQSFLAAEGVETTVHYPYALSELGWLEGKAPNAERLARRVLSLPVHEHLTTAEVEYVADRFRRAVSL